MTTRRIGGPGIRDIAIVWIFPGLLITEVVANQPWWIGNVQPGQVLGWVNIAAFTAILLLTPHLGSWPRALVAMMFVGKLGTWVTGIAGLDGVFRLGLVGSAAVAGMVIAVEKLPTVRRQASVVMIAMAPLMLLQIAGAGAWTQALTTHGVMETGESVSKEPVRTLFVSAYELRATNVQSRPAGFLHASEFASLIIIFALVLLLTAPGPRKRLAEFSACAAAVLSMAKIILLTAAIAIVWILLKGSARMKERARAFAAWLVSLLAVYWVLFPGLFWANLSFEAFAYSVLARAYEIALAVGYGALVDRQLYEVFSQTMAVSEHETLSGVGQIVRYFPYFLLALALGLPPLVVAFRRLSAVAPMAAKAAGTIMMSVTLFLIAGPFLTSPAFWFCMGFGLFPLLALVDARYLRRTVARLRRRRRGTAPHPGRPPLLPPQPDSGMNLA